MARYLIEVPHAAEKNECMRSVAVFLQSGSHFLTNAEWGCHDGEHKAWFIMDADTKEEARHVVPPAFRDRAKVLQLSKFRIEEVEDYLKFHPL
jgi:hypothetical protein